MNAIHLAAGRASLRDFRFMIPRKFGLRRKSLLLLVGEAALAIMSMTALAQQWQDAPAYAKINADNVLRRSVYFVPSYGAVYPEKFVVLLKHLPFIRGVIIHNHGCGGQIGWETHVSQFYYRQGFAVIAPEFVTRKDNKLGCAGGTREEAMASAGQRFKEGVYTARNPARLAARGDDIEQVVRWLKTQTTLPIILSGHSEGCRTVYHWNRADPQIIGGICHKQSLNSAYEHLWRWNTSLPLWSSLEDEDAWAGGSKQSPAVGFERKFTGDPGKLTTVRIAGSSHDPLIHKVETDSLQQWLNDRVPSRPPQTGFNYETALPEIQQKLQ